MGLRNFIRRVFSPPRLARRLARPEIAELADRVSKRLMQLRYAAASDDPEMTSHWNRADALDADAANSLAVRKRVRERSRLEQANNGYSIGTVRTNANYVVGRGPMLRMETGSPTFNAMVEARWQSWCKAVGFSRKLRVACKAKTGDGEAFLLIVSNPGVAHEVKLDLAELECDQVSSPTIPCGKVGRIDGVRFDEFGNPVEYEVLKQHPGGLWSGYANEATRIPARFMCHWFSADRPRQHRGMPECVSTLNLFGQGRRYREAVIAAAETAADFAAMLEMDAGNDGPDEVRPFSSLPIERRMLVATPAGGKISQLKAEQPATTYETFNRSIVSEQSRPLSMSYSIAACDSSGNSFSGTQNDHLIFYQSIDAEDRSDCELQVLDKVFAVWFKLAAHVYGWAVPATPAPRHEWGWPPMPQVDSQKAADADKSELAIGVPPSVVFMRRGLDYEDVVRIGATDYGITEDEYRTKLLGANFTKAGAPAPAEKAGESKGEEEGQKSSGLPPAPGHNGNGKPRVGAQR